MSCFVGVIQIFASGAPARIQQAPTPFALYRRWERQRWNAQAVDFSLDRCDWVALSELERWQWFWVAGFSHFRPSETHVVDCLAMLLPCLPRPDQRDYLRTQIADEIRHAYFFTRFDEEVLSAARPASDQGPLTISPAYQRLFFDSLTDVVRTVVKDPSRMNVARAAIHIFVVLEGSIALATLPVIRRLLSRTGLFPGLRYGITLAHRDEVRHAQFGLSLLQDIFAEEPAARAAAIAQVRELLPLFSKVLEPRPARMAFLRSLGMDPDDRRRRGFRYLQRHLGTLGIEGEIVRSIASDEEYVPDRAISSPS